MKKTLLALGLACSALTSINVSAEVTLNFAKDLVIDLGTNDYDVVVPTCAEATAGAPECGAYVPNGGGFINDLIDGAIAAGTDTYGSGDGNGETALFDDLGFTGLWATSVYDMTDGSVWGDFYDTNILADLNAAGVPGAGYSLAQWASIDQSLLVAQALAQAAYDLDDSAENLAALQAAGLAVMDALALTGDTTALLLPTDAQKDITLNPITDTSVGADNDDEGYGSTWRLFAEFYVEGELVESTELPDYTSGTFKFMFDDILNDANDREVLSADFVNDTVTSTGDIANSATIELLFNVRDVEEDFWFFVDSEGEKTDMFSLLPQEDDDLGPFFFLEFNVQPANPTAGELISIGDSAIRQATMDGSGQFPKPVPEPHTMALFGLGLLGMAGMARRRKSKS